MQNISNNKNIQESVNMLKALGNDTRMRILLSIFDEEKSVNAICEDIKMEQSAVSHQLQVLKLYHIVKVERKGKEVYYSLDDHHIKNIIEQSLTHASHISYEETV